MNNDFIKKLDLQVDLGKAIQDLDTIISDHNWPERTVVDNIIYPANQLGLTHRPGSNIQWIEAAGSLVDPKTGEVRGYEHEFTEINNGVPDYTKYMLQQLCDSQNIKFGRVRYMRLLPKTGLTIHVDLEPRYHLVLKTNPFALFGEYTGQEERVADCYHIPADGHFYWVNTVKPHFVFNGSWEPRVHLVISEV